MDVTRVERVRQEADAAKAEQTDPTHQVAAPAPSQDRVKRALVQARLSVGPAGDKFEQEADRVAASVMRDLARNRTGAGQFDSGDTDHPRVQRSTRFVSAPDALATTTIASASRVQRSGAGPTIGLEGGEVDADTDAAISRATGGGQPIAAPLRTSMENSFGTDFSAVRVHDDSTAQTLNQTIQAQAFTTGSDIFFGKGHYSPSTTSGQELLAHELTHVVQQRGGQIARKAAIQREPETTLLAGTATPDAVKTGTDVFDGQTATTTKNETTTFSGAQVTKTQSSLKEGMDKLSPKQIADTLEYMARVGHFGENSRAAAIERGPFSASASLDSTGSVGASTNLKTGLEVNWDAFETLAAVIEVGARVGAEFDVKGAVEAAFGPLKVGLETKLAAFAGAYVKASGNAKIGPFAVSLAAAAEAFAGAEVSGEVAGSVSVGDAKITATLEGEAMAGARAAASAGLSIGLSGVSLSASAEAFAGVKAAVSGSTTMSLKGVTFLKAKGTIEVSAGVGGKAKGEFSFEMGKLKISGGLAATLGIGTGVEAEIEIDFVALADGIQKMIVAAFYSKGEEITRESPGTDRLPLLDAETEQKYINLGYNTVIGDLQAYAARIGSGDPDRATVQKILDKRYATLKDAYKFVETDSGIRRAIAIALSSVSDLDVQAGQLRRFDGPITAREPGEAFQ